MEMIFKKTVLQEFRVTPAEFVNQHLHEVIDMNSGYHLYSYDETTFKLHLVCVLKHSEVPFNAVNRKNWIKLIPILDAK